MRLVMVFEVGDEMSYSEEYTLPVEYESKELLLNDFMINAREAIENEKASFRFLNYDFETHDHIRKRVVWKRDKNRKHYSEYADPVVYDEDPPEVFTLDEWFEINKLTLE